jgi:DNA repair protein RadC
MGRPVQTDLFREGPQSMQEAVPGSRRGPAVEIDDLGDMRRRARDFGPRALDELDALALLLDRCTAARDPGLAATALLARFGCTPRVLGATIPELARVVGHAVAADLKLAHDLMLRTLEFKVRQRPLLSSWDAVQTYLRALLAGQSREAFRVLFLDKANRLIADELMGDGTVDHAPVYPREVMRRALEFAASACCLVHNHPSGNSAPSSADIEMTRQVIEAGRALGISVHDHFLVAGDEVVSFRALGLI